MIAKLRTARIINKLLVTGAALGRLAEMTRTRFDPPKQ